MVKDGASDMDILERQPSAFIRYNRGIGVARQAIIPPLEDPKRRVYLCVGPPGSGKSYFAKHIHKHGARGKTERLWRMPVGGMGRFNGYNGQRVALIDEFHGRMSKVELVTLLQWIDKDNCQVDTKFGFVWWTPRYIWITSNYHIREWYDWSSRQKSWYALVRRLDAVFVWRSIEHDDYVELRRSDIQRWADEVPGPTAHVESPDVVIDLF